MEFFLFRYIWGVRTFDNHLSSHSFDTLSKYFEIWNLNTILYSRFELIFLNKNIYFNWNAFRYSIELTGALLIDYETCLIHLCGYVGHKIDIDIARYMVFIQYWRCPFVLNFFPDYIEEIKDNWNWIYVLDLKPSFKSMRANSIRFVTE